MANSFTVYMLVGGRVLTMTNLLYIYMLVGGRELYNACMQRAPLCARWLCGCPLEGSINH